MELHKRIMELYKIIMELHKIIMERHYIIMKLHKYCELGELCHFLKFVLSPHEVFCIENFIM